MTTRASAAGRRWYLVENLEAVAKAMEAVGLNVVWPGHPACPDITKGAPDEHWIPIVASAAWPILTQDETILRNLDQKRLLQEHKATSFFLTGGHWASWDNLRLIARHWDRIEHAANAAEKGAPRLHKITSSGVKPIRG